MNLKNKVLLLTGVGKGIGRQILDDALNDGAYVYGITRTKKNFENYQSLKKFKKNFQLFFFDVNNIKKINMVLNKSIKDKKKINCLINNAGIRQRKNFLNIKKKDLKSVFETNFYSVFFITQAYINYLIKHKVENPNIINLGSIVGKMGFEELCGYASTKTALVGFTKCLSVEFAKINLRINLVSPGFTKTSYFKNFKKNNKLYNWTKSKIPIQRWASAKEISNLVNFLISDKSSYIIGQEIFIDGGWTTK